MDSSDITFNALCLFEYICDFPDKPFAKAANQRREEVGSCQFREDLHDLAVKIEEARLLAIKAIPDLHCELMETTGCWDFEVIPALADQFADKWLTVYAIEIAGYLIALTFRKENQNV